MKTIHNPLITVVAVAVALTAVTARLQAHSEAFKPEFVTTLVSPYLAIQKALADDQFAAAKAGADEFLKAMEKAPKSGDAKEEAADLKAPAKTIAGAGDIVAARTSFLALSRKFSSLVRHKGVSSQEPLYLVHCPMAFDNKGGDWVQDTKTIANPYYGATMLRCGSVKQQIGSKD